MNLITQISEFFLVSLACGLSLCSPLASSKLTGAGFLKVLHSVCLGSIALAGIVHYASVGTELLWWYVLASTGLVLSVLFHRDDKSPVMWMLWLVQNSAFVWLLLNVSGFEWQRVMWGISSMMLLGSITYAMVLGHWYLVVPRLTEKPLLYAGVLTWVVLGIKVVVSSILLFEDSDFLRPGTTLGSGYAFNWMLVSMRMLWGYLVIGVMSWFSWRLIRMRSIQSATGVLYVMTFFVFIGELIAGYLFFQHGVYL